MRPGAGCLAIVALAVTIVEPSTATAGQAAIIRAESRINAANRLQSMIDSSNRAYLNQAAAARSRNTQRRIDGMNNALAELKAIRRRMNRRKRPAIYQRICNRIRAAKRFSDAAKAADGPIPSGYYGRTPETRIASWIGYCRLGEAKLRALLDQKRVAKGPAFRWTSGVLDKVPPPPTGLPLRNLRAMYYPNFALLGNIVPT